MSELDWNDDELVTNVWSAASAEVCDGAPTVRRPQTRGAEHREPYEPATVRWNRPRLDRARTDHRLSAPGARVARAVPSQEPSDFDSIHPVTVAAPQTDDVPTPTRAKRGVTWMLVPMMLAFASTWVVLQRSGALHIELAEQASAPRVEVYVDGQRRCDATPCVVSELTPGEHAVRVIAEGHAPSGIVPAHVSAWSTRRLTMSMPAVATGRVVALGAHPGITVRIDGVDRGGMPLDAVDLPPGEHELQFSAGERFVPMKKRIVVATGKTVDLGRVSLDLARGRLEVSLTTDGAQVWLRAGGGPPRRLSGPFPSVLELEPGDYEVVASRRGYRSVTRPVRIDAERAEQQLTIELQALDWARRDMWEL